MCGRRLGPAVQALVVWSLSSLPTNLPSQTDLLFSTSVSVNTRLPSISPLLALSIQILTSLQDPAQRLPFPRAFPVPRRKEPLLLNLSGPAFRLVLSWML